MICDAKTKVSIDKVGGKAFNLAHLSGLDVNVPQWFVLSTDAFYDFLGEKKKLYQDLLDDFNEENRKRIVDIIDRCEFSSESAEKIMNVVKEKFSSTDLVAVRSSAVDEDGENHSFAGMMDSFLNVKTDESILDCVKKCYRSCFSERISAYRVNNMLIHRDISVAVIIQKMIDPDYSGVVFTSNPRTNNPDECFISVVKGLGEKLVSGEADSTDFTVNSIGEIKIESANTDAVPDEAVIEELHKVAVKIEKSYTPRIARDIEFCVKNREVFVVQCRSIAGFAFADKNKFCTILDNSNIIESYSGVTTPLTYTFAKEVYAKIYKQTLKTFYVNPENIRAIEDDLDNMLAFFENKIYYRMNSWYKMTALYPGYEKNKKYMENMMGVKVAYNATKMQEKTRTIRIYASLLMKFLRMKKHSKNFIKKFNRVTEPFYAKNFSGINNKELKGIYDTLVREILNDFITPIANDMGAMVFYGVLTDKLKKKDIPDYEGLLSNIISKQGDVESAEQSRMLLDIIKALKEDKEALAVFDKDNAHIIDMLDSDMPVFKNIKEYIYRYGARTMDELKLETVTLFEDPTFLIDVIKGYLKTDVQAEGELKTSSEPKKQLLGYFGFWERVIVRFLINRTKYFIKNRESLRLRRTYIYSIVRNIYLGMGENFAKDGIIENKRDVFFLTKSEADSIAEGNDYDREELKRLIEKRKAEYEENKTKTIYERMCFYGDVTSQNALPIFSRQECSTLDVMQGVAGGGKVVEGVVKLVEDVSEADVRGYILMAKRTDPGWTVLFPMAEAIIIERGSVLSHSAVVAREMGLTLVVGVRGLTDRVKDGMRVRVDGINGTVEVIDDEKE